MKESDSNKIAIKDYYKGCLNYGYNSETGLFVHNLDRDLQVFVIWEGARHQEHLILDEIRDKFEILSIVDMQWSSQNFNSNIKRFYKFFNDDRINANIQLKVRNGAFTCIVVEDKAYSYRYRQNVSGPIQLVSVNALELKRKARERVGENIVHSSGCPEEFFEQAALLFTPEQLWEIIDGDWKEKRHSFKQDLVAANGWDSFEQLFKVLRLTSNYLVSRNHEYLPHSFFGNDKDVDIICDNFEDFVAAANVDTAKDKFKNYVRVEGKEVIFDIRHPDDNYLDGKWVRNVVSRKILNENNIFVLRDDDQFFTLLYHAVLQKPEIKNKYLGELESLSQKLNLDFFKLQDVSDNKKMANILEGYLKANDYCYKNPKDMRVYQNHEVLRHMSVDVKDSRAGELVFLYRKYLPSSIRSLIPASFKQLIKRFL